MNLRTRAALIPVVLLLLGAGCPVPRAQATSGVPPVDGPIIRAFDPPSENWLAGHRGIDLAASVGTPVVSVLAGRVRFVGVIDGVGVVTVSHGDTRTTYQPVRAEVEVGDQVAAGGRLGTLAAGHHCESGPCLHLGWLRGSTYLDPAELFDTASIRLLPAGSAELAEKLAAQRRAMLEAGGGNGLLFRPVPGGIGSGFGMRFHPILHRWRMHAGVDLNAACGEAIHAAAAGVVTGRSYDPASGNRLTIDHGTVGGHQLVTIYMHATDYSVRVGQRVARGQVVGRVGATGWATGCHLHLSVKLDGRLVDPAKFL